MPQFFLICDHRLLDIERKEPFGASADLSVWLASQATYSGEIVCSMKGFANVSGRYRTESDSRRGNMNGTELFFHCIQ